MPFSQECATIQGIEEFSGFPCWKPMVQEGTFMNSADNTELFAHKPVPQAVFSLVLPTVISQLITVVYNMADTFFIGQIGDPDQVAAASLCMGLFIFLTGLANLFGIGGASLISRSLGKGDREKAQSAAAFSIWTAGAVALVYGIVLYLTRETVLPLIGANQDTYEYCLQYIYWTITIGAVPTVLNATFAHLIRAEGYSRQASLGMALGGILNMVLDPIFISTFGLEIAGAAIATMLSNLVATVYFIVFIRRHRSSLVISLNPRHYTWKKRIPVDVLLVGIPSCAMNLLAVLSNIFLNRLMASYCNEAVAGLGIAKKVDMLSFAIATGMSQGVLPLIGYNYAAKNYKRMMSAVKTTFIASLTVAVVGMVLLLTCATPIVNAFIDDPLTVEYGQRFQRIMCITGPCIAVTLIIMTLFQAVGRKVQPLVLSFLRKGSLDIPLMFWLNGLIGINGIAWAPPIADAAAMVVALCLFLPFWKELKGELEKGSKE